MTDEELDARFKELEEHATACSTIAAASTTELVAALAGILVQRGVCTPQNIMEYLSLILEDAAPAKDDPVEMKMGKEMLAKLIGLPRLRLEAIEAARTLSSNSPTLQ